MSRNPERRAALADAVIEVLAREGARGVTFRAVDAQAELPPGTAKNYFSGRTALLRHAAEHLRERLGGEDSAARDQPTGSDAVADLVRAQFEHISQHRTAYLALLELRLEAVRRPEVRDVLTPIVRDELTTRAAEHQQSPLPGGATDSVLLYLGMLGLIVEHLTLPDVLAPREPEELLDELTRRIILAESEPESDRRDVR